MSNLTASEVDEIIFGRAPCSACGNTTDTIERCNACDRLKHMRKTLRQALPAKYQECNFRTLVPHQALCQLPVARQQELLDRFRANPDASVMMYGAPGTSKTTFSCAFIRRAIERDWKYFYTPVLGGVRWDRERWIWRVTFDTLMAQYLDKQSDRDAPEPDVTPERIKAATDKGRKFVLVLEEVDKARLTEHRMNKLFSIIDTLYNCEGQLVMNTNLTPEEFEAMFTQTDNLNINVTGAAFLRRVQEMCEVYDLFS